MHRRRGRAPAPVSPVRARGAVARAADWPRHTLAAALGRGASTIDFACLHAASIGGAGLVRDSTAFTLITLITRDLPTRFGVASASEQTSWRGAASLASYAPRY